MRVFFAKNGHQHVGTGHFLLATARGLHVHDGALDDALKTQRGLGVDVFGTGRG
jgi:phosphoglycerate dehydrogenase-like enzyme